jgi:hypothetical protein
MIGGCFAWKNSNIRKVIFLPLKEVDRGQVQFQQKTQIKYKKVR